VYTSYETKDIMLSPTTKAEVPKTITVSTVGVFRMVAQSVRWRVIANGRRHVISVL